MARRSDDIVIQEPPLQEFQKKRSCLSRTCLTGGGCLVIVVILIVAITQLAAGPRTFEMKDIPDDVLSTAPIYDIINNERIVFISGQERNSAIETIALLPKILFSPVIAALVDEPPGATYIEKVQAVVQQPVSDHRDEYTIEWRSLTASPNFVYEYYRTELAKQSFEVTDQSANNTVKQLSFMKGAITGNIFIRDDGNTDNGTTFVRFTLYIPSDK